MYKKFSFRNKFFADQIEQVKFICDFFKIKRPYFGLRFDETRLKNKDLKKCPFCGGQPWTVTDMRDGSSFIECEECGTKSIKNYPRTRLHNSDDGNSLHIPNYDYAQHILVGIWNNRSEQEDSQ